MKKALFIILTSIISCLYAIEPEDIIKKLEDNLVHETSFIKGKMIISDRFGNKETSFKSYTQGADEALIEFTSKEEIGQKILRTHDDLYLFFPDAQEIIRLSGSALKDSVLGSDMSYEDMTGNKDLVNKYELKLLGTGKINDKECYAVDLKAKTRDVPYAHQIIWIDTKLFCYQRIQQFTVSEDLMKEINTIKTMSIKNKVIPSEISIESKIKKNSKTVFIIETIDIGIDIPENTFSIEELTW